LYLQFILPQACPLFQESGLDAQQLPILEDRRARNPHVAHVLPAARVHEV
jgi:hypothetical protein